MIEIKMLSAFTLPVPNAEFLSSMTWEMRSVDLVSAPVTFPHAT